MKFIVHIERHSTERVEVEAENRDDASTIALDLVRGTPCDSDDSVYKVEEIVE